MKHRPFDDPGYSSSLIEYTDSADPTIYGVGFGHSLGLNTGTKGIAENYMQVFVRREYTDVDGDGYTAWEDCDDDNPAVWDDSNDAGSYSMSFDGVEDTITLLSNSSWDLEGDFTIQAWWNKDIGSTNNAFWTIGDSYSDGLELYVGDEGTITKVYSGGGPVINADYNPSPGEWHHYAVVRDSGVVKLYVDGIQDPNTWSSNLTFIGDLVLGFEVYNDPNFSYPEMWCDGLVDNFEIWNIALTQEEIQQYMSCPPTGNEAGLAVYWNFETGSGTTAYDQTSNGNNGTINGATYTTNVPP